ncbi:MAG TPA: hypothetical protein VGM03_22325 [Phycisphaerae bacterium]
MVATGVRPTVFIVAGLVLSSRVVAGPEWCEVSDAGSTRATAQVITVAGPVTKIKCGSLSTGLVADYEDMYLLRINDNTTFLARTINVPPDDPTDFNTELWLFDANGFGIVGNDDAPAPPATTLSQLLPMANDNSGAMITGPGCFYLAVSGHANVPVSAGGVIFNQNSATEISGPDGPGGGLTHLGWSGPGAVGHYTVELMAVSGPPCANIPAVDDVGLGVLVILVAMAGIILIRRRRPQPATPL